MALLLKARLNSNILKYSYASIFPKRRLPLSNSKLVVCFVSTSNDNAKTIVSGKDQVDTLRAGEVEFGPSRAQDVFHNAVEESSDKPVPENSFRISKGGDEDKEHLAGYQSSSTVHLNAVMQSMVPDPFVLKGKAPTHLNMPGGTWSQGEKYLSDNRLDLRQSSSTDQSSINQSSADAEQPRPVSEAVVLTRRQKLQQAVKDYGSTVLVFHVTLSLCSLGLSYAAVSSGLDVAALLAKIGFSVNAVAIGGSTFVVAYAFHKVLAPARIAITLSATPFIVRYLRRVGFLNIPKAK